MSRRRQAGYERRAVTTGLVAVALPSLTLLALALAGDFSAKVRWTALFVVVLATLVGGWLLHERVSYPLRTLSNLITALREGDYALRGRLAGGDDAFGEVTAEVNALAATLAARRLEAVEATALLRAVLAEIDAAIFAFDQEDRLRLVNRAGERLLGEPVARLLGRSAADLALGDLLDGATPAVVDRGFAGAAGRWNVRRSTFRQAGLPHRLLVVADIRRALREEEAEAWRRIVRVLGHELNNSLAPIRSIAESTAALAATEPLPASWREDLTRGMRVIGSRSAALGRFTRAYAGLARLPEPRRAAVRLGELARRVAALESRLPVEVTAGPEVTVAGDADQLEQLLINLVKNAADAALETGGGVALRWRRDGDAAQLSVEDEGPGLHAGANLFVPFFTTKPNGTGVGLVLSRQIAEAHGGTLTLENRAAGNGCVAVLRLPRAGGRSA